MPRYPNLFANTPMPALYKKIIPKPTNPKTTPIVIPQTTHPTKHLIIANTTITVKKAKHTAASTHIQFYYINKCTLIVSIPKFRKLSCCKELANELALLDKALFRTEEFGRQTRPRTAVD